MFALRVLVEVRLNAVVGSDRHGALDHHDRIAREGLRELLGHRHHEAQVGRAVVSLRRTHGDEHHLHVGHALGHVCGKHQAMFARVASHQIVEARLVDGDLVFTQLVDLARVAVYADHAVSELRETCASDEADVP